MGPLELHGPPGAPASTLEEAQELSIGELATRLARDPSLYRVLKQVVGRDALVVMSGLERLKIWHQSGG